MTGAAGYASDPVVLRFHVDIPGGSRRLLSDDEVREALIGGTLETNVRLRLLGATSSLPAMAYATFGSQLRDTLPAAPPPPEEAALVDGSVVAPSISPDLLLFFIAEGSHSYGPVTGIQLKQGLASGRFDRAAVSVVGTHAWGRATHVFGVAQAASAPVDEEDEARCAICLEMIGNADVCPYCEESTSVPPSTATSIGRDAPADGWLKMHWRPLVTLGAIGSLVFAGIALRHLAPDRFEERQAQAIPATETPACEPACWPGEACQVGHCVWSPPNDVGRIADDPTLVGPFDLSADASDILLLDDERMGVALLAGMEVRAARTGEVMGLVSGAPQVRDLYAVGDAIYGVGPQHLYVIDGQTEDVLKTLELGGIVGELALGASGRRALVSLPGLHSVAVIATDMHAEVDRFRFGEDRVGPLAVDDTGERALAVTGSMPTPGRTVPTIGAMYAFDPSALAVKQDRIRTSMSGNPVSVAITPDGSTAWVALREENEIVKLAWQSSGTFRVSGEYAVCDEPEEIELVRRKRRAVVRCHASGDIEIRSSVDGKLLRSVALGRVVTDVAVTPDGTRALAAIPGRGKGAVAVIDLDSGDVQTIAIDGDPSEIVLSPTGRVAAAMSKRTKQVWVIR